MPKLTIQNVLLPFGTIIDTQSGGNYTSGDICSTITPAQIIPDNIDKADQDGYGYEYVYQKTIFYGTSNMLQSAYIKLAVNVAPPPLEIANNLSGTVESSDMLQTNFYSKQSLNPKNIVNQTMGVQSTILTFDETTGNIVAEDCIESHTPANLDPRSFIPYPSPTFKVTAKSSIDGILVPFDAWLFIGADGGKGIAGQSSDQEDYINGRDLTIGTNTQVAAMACYHHRQFIRPQGLNVTQLNERIIIEKGKDGLPTVFGIGDKNPTHK